MFDNVFDGKAVLVTGGTRGIGLAMALAFAQAGARVHVTGTRASRADYDGDLSQFEFHRAELGRGEDRERLADAIGELDVLVNNAGQSGDNEMELDQFETTLQLNLVSAMDLSCRFHDRFVRRGGGSVINIGSLASFLSIARSPGYTASKAGLLGLTRSLADRWAHDSVRVNMIAPGFIMTELMASRYNGERAEKILQAIPAGRWGTPDDVAGAALFLASPAAAYITGTSLTIDGGIMLR